MQGKPIGQPFFRPIPAPHNLPDPSLSASENASSETALIARKGTVKKHERRSCPHLFCKRRHFSVSASVCPPIRSCASITRLCSSFCIGDDMRTFVFFIRMQKDAVFSCTDSNRSQGLTEYITIRSAAGHRNRNLYHFGRFPAFGIDGNSGLIYNISW